jgi:hypothetical protein
VEVVCGEVYSAIRLGGRGKPEVLAVKPEVLPVAPRTLAMVVFVVNCVTVQIRCFKE